MLSITLNSHNSRPLIDQIVSGIQDQIDNKVLRIGSRLPSIRQFATQHKISTFTVVQAYDRLVASGYVNSRRGSGFYIAKQINPLVPKKSPICDPNRAMDVIWLLHQSFHTQPHRHPVGLGWLPEKWQDKQLIERGLRHLSRIQSGYLMDYGNAYGYLPLRQQLKRHLYDIGVTGDDFEIITTNGVTHAIDLVTRYLVQAGDTVMVDDPGYFSSFGYLKSLGAKLIGVPRNTDGPDIEVMTQLVKQHRPKAFFIGTVLHNPTGTSLSQAIAYRILRLAEEYNFTIVEDDIYGDFHGTPTTRIASLDQLQRVVYVNSFSKTISPNIRVGYLACHQDLARELVDLKLLTNLTTSEMNERLIYSILTEGYYRKYLEKLRTRLQQAREPAMESLEKIGLQFFHPPEYGMFLWAKLPNCTDTAPIAALAEKEDIMLAPGHIFRPHQEPSPWLRFNVAFTNQPAVLNFLERVIDTL